MLNIPGFLSIILAVLMVGPSARAAPAPAMEITKADEDDDDPPPPDSGAPPPIRRPVGRPRKSAGVRISVPALAAPCARGLQQWMKPLPMTHLSTLPARQRV